MIKMDDIGRTRLQSLPLGLLTPDLATKSVLFRCYAIGSDGIFGFRMTAESSKQQSSKQIGIFLRLRESSVV